MGTGDSKTESLVDQTQMSIGPTLPHAPEAPGIAPGDCLGRYTVRARIGAGGMGDVFSAVDPELDRLVALKVLRAGLASDVDRQVRLQREAQAMARLNHPNVVSIFDVGTIGDRVFVAMELVDGPTLEHWLAAEQRSWREIVDVFVQAGRGLEAAHAAGIVHRDFKPSNVILGDRVRVADFGLARMLSGHKEPDDAQASTLLGLAVTQTGQLMGTPGYMSPEQRAGAPVTAATDQYSFCVALHEALYGARPKKEKLRQGVPRWLGAVVARGLQARPEARYPSMAALLADLTRGLHRARRRRLAAGFVAASSLLGVAAWALGKTGAARPAELCPPGRDKLSKVWDSERRSATEDAFRRSGLPYADDSLRAVLAGMDAWADAWAEMRTSACQATRVRGEQSDELLDLRMRCLDDRLVEARALGDLLVAADAGAVAQGPRAVAGLTGVEGCANAAFLREAAPLPDRPATVSAIAAVRSQLGLVAALRATGRHPEALAHARAAAVAAHGLGWNPLAAEAEFALGRAFGQTSDFEAARRALIRAVAAAEAGRRDDIKAQAWTQLGWISTISGHKPGDESYLPLARAAIIRLGERDDPGRELSALLARTEGRALAEAGKYEEGLRRLNDGYQAWQRLHPGSLMGADFIDIIADVEISLGRIDDGLAHAREALELVEKILGPHHPDVGPYCNGMTQALERKGDLPAARAFAARGLELAPNDHMRAVGYQNLSALDDELGDHALAADEAEAGAGLAVKVYGEESARTGRVLLNLTAAQIGARRLDAAMATATRTLAIFEKVRSPDHPDIGQALATLGQVELESGKLDAASRDLGRARALFERMGEGSEQMLCEVFLPMAKLSLRRGHDQAAAAEAQRARELAKKSGNEEILPQATFVLARAVAGSDPSRAQQLGAEAAEAFRARGRAGASQLAEVETWLAQGARRGK